MQPSLAFDHAPILPQIRERLLAVFGPQRDAERADPLSQFVAAFISTRTHDDVSVPAFRRLRRRYQTWEALARATAAEIEPVIRPVTFADKKALFLPSALRMIIARSGSLDLHFLADWDEEMAMQWLDGLPGVGPKIAATVLNFSTLRKRNLSVDTHLLRVGKRLRLLSPRADYDSGYEPFMRLVPHDWDADDLYEFHWLMKYLGQRDCTHALPACARCPLRDLCSSGAPAPPADHCAAAAASSVG